jgi:hypothetical protein
VIVLRAAALAALPLCGACKFAHAHQQWADGGAVPDWVKAWCCGPADAHRDAPIERHKGQTYVTGLRNPVDEEKIFDSQDGHIWAFFNEAGGDAAVVYCLFVPPTL